MDELSLLVDLHRKGLRQGPGGEAETRLALSLAGLDSAKPLNVADIGCGTGASTIQLAQTLNANIVAVDFLPEFLEELQEKAKREGVEGSITTLNCSMDALAFSQDQFDVIWSEGAVYNMGFEAGVAAWRPFLKTGGKLVVSEITWLTGDRPAELQSYWESEYPEIAPASAKIEVLERHGYSLEGFFVLPRSCWTENYYQPLAANFDAFLERHDYSESAKKVVAMEMQEIALYEQYSDFYGYGVYVARKL
ncbi:class I SAM-dependent methyltransferase [Desulfovibrio oxyclinae]|uniref:class I SAM-dependent methyltransferase n=1 Tax=Desulfovibrio oxyclinae TaxID=63560 RepID=UPI00036C8C30|nr:class I SAM-dependent methyltransferase [Desulfovibrio oxyclinae]